MSARDAVLARIRRALRHESTASGAHAVEAHLARRARGPLPALPADLVGRFRENAARLASTVVGPLSAAEAPAAIARYLTDQKLPPRAVCWPDVAELDWKSAGLKVEARPAREDDPAGITGAFCAIAETGTLMLLSGARTPPTVSLLPETHIALLPVARIVAHMEDGWDLLRREFGAVPRAVNFVSGPSRTADIEQTVTLGAHGPYRVHIVLVA